MATLHDLLDLANSEAPGPSPTFGAAHVLLAFLTIADSTYVGRQALAKKSRLGEGAARTVLKKMKESGYVDTIRSGAFLTSSGKTLARSAARLMSGISSIGESDLTVGDHQAALVLRGAAGKVRSGIEQRDSSIRVGAAGATTYVVRRGKFAIPGGSSDCERDFPRRTWSDLKKNLKPRNDDVIILCGAGDEVSARLGVLAAAITLL